MTSQSLSSAIAIMTAWASNPDDTEFMRTTAAEIATETDDGPVEVIRGLITLSSILLVRIEKRTGVSPSDTLQEIATRYDGVG